MCIGSRVAVALRGYGTLVPPIVRAMIDPSRSIDMISYWYVWLRFICRGVHQNHKIIPLEVASKRSRAILEKEVFPHLNSVAGDFGRIKEQQVPALKRQYQQLKSDGDELIREMRTLAEGAWFEECRQQAKFIGILEGEEPLKWCEAEKEKFTELMNDSRLNRLADAVDATTLSNLKQKTAKLGLKPDQWPKLKDCFQVLTPYLPGWDVEVPLTCSDCGRFVKFKF